MALENTELELAIDSWKQEKNSAYLYGFVAQYSDEPSQQKLFHQLSSSAEQQAKIWETQILKLGGKSPTYQPNLRTRLIVWLIRKFGPKQLRFILAAMKIRGMSIYSITKFGHPKAKILEDVARRHKSISSGNNLRAAVFGINDGLISNASLIMGMAGSLVAIKTIILAGIAGLFAGAFSMAAGELVSVRSQREMFEYQINLEKSELELYPKEEAAELSLIYQARGLAKDDANKVANLMMQNPDLALDTLAREELGLDPDDLVSPFGAAIFSFCSFVVGAFIPLVAFFFFSRATALGIAIVLTACCIFVVGAILSLYTGRNAIRSGLRMLVIGTLAGGITYFIGHLVGTTLG